jgi:hypothetical protein
MKFVFTVSQFLHLQIREKLTNAQIRKNIAWNECFLNVMEGLLLFTNFARVSWIAIFEGPTLKYVAIQKHLTL